MARSTMAVQAAAPDICLTRSSTRVPMVVRRRHDGDGHDRQEPHSGHGRRVRGRTAGPPVRAPIRRPGDQAGFPEATPGPILSRRRRVALPGEHVGVRRFGPVPRLVNGIPGSSGRPDRDWRLFRDAIEEFRTRDARRYAWLLDDVDRVVQAYVLSRPDRFTPSPRGPAIHRARVRGDRVGPVLADTRRSTMCMTSPCGEDRSRGSPNPSSGRAPRSLLVQRFRQIAVLG